MTLHPFSRRRRVARALVALVVVLFAAACGGEPPTENAAASDVAPAGSQAIEVVDDESTSQDNAGAFAPTPEFLAYAVDQVEAQDTYRFEMFQTFETGLASNMGDADVPMAEGEVRGDVVLMRMDLGRMLGGFPLPPAMLDGDLTMTMVFDGTDGDTMYLNAPFFQTIAGLDPSLSADNEWIDALATGWGLIDLSVISGQNGLLGAMGVEPTDTTQILRVLDEAGTVVDGGAGVVRGVPTQIATATVDVDAFLAASGVETNVPADSVGSLGPIDVEVHVDSDDLVRRIEYRLAFDDPTVGFTIDTWQRVDFFDFGDDVEVEVPTDAGDVTEDLARLGGF